jgi:glycine cleavage system aminomethyltransferase T
VRASRTGEYCYLLLVPADEAEAFLAQTAEAGAALDLLRVEDAALFQCALETGHFNIHREGRAEGVTPIELQLQWRISYKREYPGAAALRERRLQGARRRLTTVLSPGELTIGDAVVLADQPIGMVVNTGYCAARRAWVAAALLDRPYAVSGIDRYAAVHAGVQTPLRTVSPPVVCQRSLFVTPGQHSYLRRAEYAFPQL